MAAPSDGSPGLRKELGTRDVFVAGVALVVASTTLVSDFQGYFALGASFAMAILIAFVINLLLGLSASELAVAFPRAGAIYEYGRDAFGGTVGKLVGLFLGLTFVGMFVLAGPGETSAGAFGLQALFNTESGINWFILVLVVLALVPNILGIKITAWVNVALLTGMLLIRWFFGLAGFLGFSDAGGWSSSNLDAGGPGAFDWFGSDGLLAGALILAFWTFVGIEFVCSLTEEVREPRKAMPRGIIIGLVVILATSWLMGLGVAGTAPDEGAWADIALGEPACNDSCPQLVVGEVMFGGFGRGLMALASVFATLGSLSVAFAALPRIIFGVARNGQLFGPQVSSFFARVHPRWGTPVNATVLFAVAATVLALRSSDVVDWIFSGAYVWILLYIAYHVVAFADRLIHPHRHQLFGPWFLAVPIAGAIGSAVGLYYAFDGAHGTYGGRALIVLAVAAVATVVAYLLPGGDDQEVIDLTAEGDELLGDTSDTRRSTAQPAVGES